MTDPVILDLTAVVGWRADVAGLIDRIRAGDDIAALEAELLLDRGPDLACTLVDRVAGELTERQRTDAVDALCLVVNSLGNLFELHRVLRDTTGVV